MTPNRTLDAIRGVLSILVVLGHSMDIFIFPEGSMGRLAAAANRTAHASVICFFALSGFLIASSIDANRRRGFSSAAYAAARVFRIVPPLLIVIGLTWLFALALREAGFARQHWYGAERQEFVTDPYGQILALLTAGLAGELRGAYLNGPLWSLTYEIQLYVVVGLLASAVFYTRVWIRLAALGAAVAFAHAAANPLFLACGLVFGLGVVSYMAREAAARALYAWIATCILATLAMAYALATPRSQTSFAQAYAMAANVAFAGAFAGVLVLVARTRALDRLYKLGSFSYTLYILHFPLLLVAQFTLYNAAPSLLGREVQAVVWVAVTAAVLLLCMLVAAIVERPKQQRAWLSARLGTIGKPLGGTGIC